MSTKAVSRENGERKVVSIWIGCRGYIWTGLVGGGGGADIVCYRCRLVSYPNTNTHPFG